MGRAKALPYPGMTITDRSLLYTSSCAHMTLIICAMCVWWKDVACASLSCNKDLIHVCPVRLLHLELHSSDMTLIRLPQNPQMAASRHTSACRWWWRKRSPPPIALLWMVKVSHIIIWSRHHVWWVDQYWIWIRNFASLFRAIFQLGRFGTLFSAGRLIDAIRFLPVI